MKNEKKTPTRLDSFESVKELCWISKSSKSKSHHQLMSYRLRLKSKFQVEVKIEIGVFLVICMKKKSLLFRSITFCIEDFTMNLNKDDRLNVFFSPLNSSQTAISRRICSFYNPAIDRRVKRFTFMQMNTAKNIHKE